MQKRWIIAESGGTKTDWVLLQDGEIIQQLQTGSFHPQLLTDTAVETVSALIPDLLRPENVFIIYSAGCYREEGKQLMREKLSSLKAEIHIKSDLEAAIACTGKESGWVAILGTGSALMRFDQDGFELFGGLGWESGDEGSGFYFGKLIVEAILAGEEFSEIDKEQQEFLRNNLGKPASKQAFSQLSKQLDKSVYAKYHRLNVELFIQRYLIPNQVEKICLVGGYVAFVLDEVKDVFEKYSIEIECVISKPITQIVHYFRDKQR